MDYYYNQVPVSKTTYYRRRKDEPFLCHKEKNEQFNEPIFETKDRRNSNQIQSDDFSCTSEAISSNHPGFEDNPFQDSSEVEDDDFSSQSDDEDIARDCISDDEFLIPDLVEHTNMFVNQLEDEVYDFVDMSSTMEDESDDAYEMYNKDQFSPIFKELSSKDMPFKLDFQGDINGIDFIELVMFMLEMKKEHRVQDAILDRITKLFHRMNSKFPKCFKSIKSKVLNQHTKYILYHCRH